jgi:pimeloyl-ACP methyl ester carboxylesterase
VIAPTSVTYAGSEGDPLRGDLWDGGGKPVVFLHGGGQTRRAWDATARSVAEQGMRAITLDLRGHGESGWPAGGGYTFAHFADDVAAALEQIAERHQARPAVVGASMGGLAALICALRRSELMDSLVLVDVTPRMNLEGAARILGFMGERMEEGFASLDEAADAIARYLPHRKRPSSQEGLRKNLRLDADGRYRWHWDPAFMKSAENINTGARELMEDVLARLPSLRTPVLLVRGLQSELVDEAYAREFVALAPNARYVDVRGAGHMVAGDRNDAFRAAILDFLTVQPAA